MTYIGISLDYHPIDMVNNYSAGTDLSRHNLMSTQPLQRGDSCN